MSNPARNGAFIYALHVDRLADFYVKLLNLRIIHRNNEMAILSVDGFQLVIHQFPPEVIGSISISSPPPIRESAIKLFFSVPSLQDSGDQVTQLGGSVLPGLWSGPGFRVCNAVDPEGNIFQMREFDIPNRN